jgi:hypothetical protein
MAKNYEKVLGPSGFVRPQRTHIINSLSYEADTMTVHISIHLQFYFIINLFFFFTTDTGAAVLTPCFRTILVNLCTADQEQSAPWMPQPASGSGCTPGLHSDLDLM